MPTLYNITPNPEQAERHMFCEALKLYANYRGLLKDKTDQLEYDIFTLPESELVCERFSLYGRSSATKKIMHNNEGTTSIGLIEMQDGRFYYEQKEDFVKQVLTGVDENEEPVYTGYNIEYSKLVSGFSWDEVTETQPQKKVIEE